MNSKTKLVLTIVLMTISNWNFAQCFSCEGSNTGAYANAMGFNNTALGAYSSAFGLSNQITSDAVAAVALGSYNNLTKGHAIAIGRYLNATGTASMVIGVGEELKPLVNSFGSTLMVGFRSDLPTFFVGCSNGEGTTGQVGIGNTGLPLAKLHLRADEGEDAAIYVQPHNWLEGDGAGLALGDMSHGISAMKDKGLIFNTSSYYNFNSGYLKIGLEARAGSVLVCADNEGTARWMQIDTPPPSPWTSLETGDIYYNKGKVGIGTINTTPYALAVKGNIITDEVMVKHYDMWPDFVFKPGFVLKTLQEVEHFIDKNHHLPDVPSANEIKENGYAVGEMNALLLQKIEELTLYIIDQEKRLQTQQQQIEQQRLEFDSFMKTIEQK